MPTWTGRLLLRQRWQPIPPSKACRSSWRGFQMKWTRSAVRLCSLQPELGATRYGGWCGQTCLARGRRIRQVLVVCSQCRQRRELAKRAFPASSLSFTSCSLSPGEGPMRNARGPICGIPAQRRYVAVWACTTRLRLCVRRPLLGQTFPHGSNSLQMLSVLEMHVKVLHRLSWTKRVDLAGTEVVPASQARVHSRKAASPLTMPDT